MTRDSLSIPLSSVAPYAAHPEQTTAQGLDERRQGRPYLYQVFNKLVVYKLPSPIPIGSGAGRVHVLLSSICLPSRAESRKASMTSST